MKKGFIQISTLLIVSLFMVSLLVGRAIATQHEEVCFCHDVAHNPTTICTDEEGLINGHTAHVDAGFDTLGACTEATVTQLPSIIITPTSCRKPTVTQGIIPTSIPSITATPTAELTPSQNGGSSSGDGKSDGKSDGRSDGRSSSPQVPAGPPSTGRGALPPCTYNTCGWK